MYICYILPVPANDIAIENIFFYTFWFKYSTSTGMKLRCTQ